MRRTARTAWLVTLSILAGACEVTSPTRGVQVERVSAIATPTPTPAPTVTPSPSPGPINLNYVFLTAPAARPQPVTSLAGRYQLDVDFGDRTGDRCASIPESTFRRSYTADIAHVGPHHAVKLYDAKFLSDGPIVGFGCGDPRLPQAGHAVCHQFMLTGDATALSVSLRSPDEWRGSEIWEGMSDGFLMQLIGSATGAMSNGQIEANGTGSIWYGNGLPASIVYSCTSRALKFTFTPK